MRLAVPFFALSVSLGEGEMKYKTWVRRDLLKLYRDTFGLRRFLILDYWWLKLGLARKRRM
jgi:hypothetical protein